MATAVSVAVVVAVAVKVVIVVVAVVVLAVVVLTVVVTFAAAIYVLTIFTLENKQKLPNSNKEVAVVTSTLSQRFHPQTPGKLSQNLRKDGLKPTAVAVFELNRKLKLIARLHLN